MNRSKRVLRLIIFAVAAAAVWVIAGVTGLFRGQGPAAGLQVNWGNIVGIVVMILAVLAVAHLLLLLLSLPKPEGHRARTVLALVTNMVKYAAAIVIVCGVIALLGVDVPTVLAGLGIIALIIGFGAESLIADVVTGAFILLDNQYNVGDIIEVGGFRGTVSDIGIRTTCVTDTGGNVKIINNSEMKNVLNRSDNASKAVTDFAVPYATDLAAVEQKLPALLERIYAENSDVFKSMPVYLGVQELGESSVVLRFVAEVGESDIYNGARRLNRGLLLGFRSLGVECPFPQMDVHTS